VTTVYTREGIVMAADSRPSLNLTKPRPGGAATQHLGVAQTDSTSKLFLARDSVGISTFGAADIGGLPLTGYIESFISDALSNADSPKAVADEILLFFTQFDAVA
jgi:hypothetical protein